MPYFCIQRLAIHFYLKYCNFILYFLRKEHAGVRRKNKIRYDHQNRDSWAPTKDSRNDERARGCSSRIEAKDGPRIL